MADAAPVVYVQRVEGKWLAWFNRPNDGKRWTLQMNVDFNVYNNWFTPPSINITSSNVSAIVPNVPKAFFRAKRLN